jgi:hypothetical protein
MRVGATTRTGDRMTCVYEECSMRRDLLATVTTTRKLLKLNTVIA